MKIRNNSKAKHVERNIIIITNSKNNNYNSNNNDLKDWQSHKLEKK